jgi:hypothetical protein
LNKKLKKKKKKGFLGEMGFGDILGKNGKSGCLAAGGGAKMAGERPAVVSGGWRGW